MHLDVQDLRNFYYRSTLGRAAQAAIRGRLIELWPEAKGQTVAGFGFAVPLLRPYLSDARRVIGLMPLSEAYAITARADGFTPGEKLRALMHSAHSLPQSFETLELDMVTTFDKVWDRSALEDSRPQPVAIDLRLVEIKWGELRLFATGDLDVDAQGIPTGEIAVKAENWRDMIAMANAAGALPDQAVNPVTRALNFLAGLGGNPNALDLQLNFRDGFVALGPLPLGPAPRLILR